MKSKNLFSHIFQNKLFTDSLIVLGIILLSLCLILPYFKSGYFPTHDGEWAVVRLSEMFREIRDMQFPPRFSGVLNNGYGYPLFNFAYPFPYYTALIFKLGGFDFVTSIKLVFALSVPFSGIGMYLFSRNLWKSRAGGFISAVLYMFLPYRIVDLYVRGSIGESLAFALVPFLLYFVLKLKNSVRSLIYVSFISFILAALILTHNIMAVYYVTLFIVLALLSIIFSKQKKNLWFGISFVLGIGMSAFFWFPAFSEKSDILLSVIPIADRSLYFVKFSQLILPSWGYGIPTDSTDAFSYQLGIGVIATILILIYVFLSAILKKTKFDETSKTALVFFIIFLGMLAMLFPFTHIIWEHLPILKEINYPWTLLAPLGFVGTLLSGYIVSRSKIILYMFIAMSVINGFVVFQYAHPKEFVNRGEGYYATNQATTTSSSEYTPLWVKKFPLTSPNQKVEITKGSGEVSNIVSSSKQISFQTNLKSNGVVQINTIYYPGWEIKSNNVIIPISYKNTYGVMQIPLQKGSYSIVAKFGETKPRLISDIVSTISFGIAGLLFVIGFFQFIISYGKKRK